MIMLIIFDILPNPKQLTFEAQGFKKF